MVHFQSYKCFLFRWTVDVIEHLSLLAELWCYQLYWCSSCRKTELYPPIFWSLFFESNLPSTDYEVWRAQTWHTWYWETAHLLHPLIASQVFLEMCLIAPGVCMCVYILPCFSTFPLCPLYAWCSAIGLYLLVLLAGFDFFGYPA